MDTAAFTHERRASNALAAARHFPTAPPAPEYR